MSSQIQVDTHQIQAGSADMERRAGRLVEDIAGMNRCVEDLLATWHGTAALGFGQAAQAWMASQRQMHEALVALRTALSQSGVQYSEVEAANAARFRA